MGSILSALPLLACPVGMGLMMWMMRGKKEPAAVAAPGRSVELLREERRRLDAEIEDFETVDDDPRAAMSVAVVVVGTAAGLACPTHMWWQNRRGRAAACGTPARGATDARAPEPHGRAAARTAAR